MFESNKLAGVFKFTSILGFIKHFRGEFFDKHYLRKQRIEYQAFKNEKKKNNFLLFIFVLVERLIQFIHLFRGKLHQCFDVCG